MTNIQHPITPPPELLQQWATEYWGNPGESIGEGEKYIATQAARWGFRQCIKVDAAWLEDKLQKARDQELEACMEWMRSHFHGVPQWADELRATRRPKPPSLVEEALNALVHLCDGASNSMDTVEAAEYIQRALERLQQLEDSND